MSQERGEGAEVGNEPVVGEFRYFSTVGLVVRVISFSKEVAVVEHLPGGHRVELRATRELMEAAVVHSDGFRVSWCSGKLSMQPGSELALLKRIRLDEEANGRDRIKLRALDDYLAPILNSQDLRKRLRDALTDCEDWVSVGRGSELGYVPAGALQGWKERWRRVSLPLYGGAELVDEGDAIQALQVRLGRCSYADLGQVATTKWLPSALRRDAVGLLVERWKLGQDRANFKTVADEAMEQVAERIALQLPAKFLNELILSDSISFRVRTYAIMKGRSSSDAASLAHLLPSLSLVSDTPVLLDLLRLSSTNEESVLVLSQLLRVSCPEASVNRDVDRRLTEFVQQLGASLLHVVLLSVRRALSHGAKQATIEAWLCRLNGTSTPSIVEVCRAIATLEVLEQGGTELVTLAAHRPIVERGLTRWIRSDWEGEITESVDIVQVAGGPHGVSRVSKLCQRQVEARDHEKLGTWVCLLGSEVQRLVAEVGVLKEAVQDTANAERVLGKAAADIVRNHRKTLVDSAMAEAAHVRAREREAVARMVRESVTALERSLGSDGSPVLEGLVLRLRELAEDIGLLVVGRVGDVVEVDPVEHETTARLGTKGEVRRVGVVDVDGVVYSKPAVVGYGG